MIKTVYSFLIASIIAVFAFSCSSDPVNKEQSFEFDIPIDFSGLFENGVLIGNLSDQKGTSETLKYLINESKEYEDRSNIVYRLNKIENDLYMTSYAIYNAKNELVRTESVDNEGSAKIKISKFPSGFTNSFPTGYKELGTCSNANARIEECTVELIINYFSANLTASGDCREVILSVDTNSARVLGRNCLN